MNPRNLVLSLACLALASCGRSEPPKDDHAKTEGPAALGHEDESNEVEIDESMIRDLRITTRIVESRPGGERATLLGELAVDQRRYAEVATPAGARIVRVLVDSGERVKKGDVLAELTSADLGRARAEYVSASARVRLSEAAFERKRGLASENIVPLREVQEAESALAEALAAQRAGRAALTGYGVEVPSGDDPSGAFALHAPIDGWVIERNAAAGALTEPSIAAFKIGDLKTLWLTVHAFERDAVRIRKGTLAQLSFSALPGQDYEGRVTLVGRNVERESRTIPVRIDVVNRTGELRPGMSATAALPIGDAGESILTVPVASVQRVRGEWCVFIPKEDDQHFEIRRIGRGRDLGASVEILSGLSAGDKVVVDGAFLLKAQAEKGAAGHDDH